MDDSEKNDEIMIVFWGFRGWHQKIHAAAAVEDWGNVVVFLLSHVVAYLEVYTMFTPLSA